MTSALHKDLSLGEVHAPISFEYADTAARTAATGFVSSDVGKFARQIDENSLWLLTAVTPTWKRLSPEASAIDHQALAGSGSNTHEDIDTHIGDTDNPHSMTPEQIGNSQAQWNADKIQGVAVSTTAPTAGQILKAIDGESAEWASDVAGEINSAENIGSAGVGIFKVKVGVNVQLKKLNPASAAIVVTDDTDNDKIDLDIDTSEISHQDLSGAGTNTHASIDDHIGSSSNPHAVTAEQVGNDTAQWNADRVQDIAINPAAPTAGQVLKATSGTAAAWGDGGDPGPHKASHVSGGTDAFTATDLLEALVKRLRESGSADLELGAIADGQVLKRNGTNIVGATMAPGKTLGSAFAEVTADTTTTSTSFVDLLSVTYNKQSATSYLIIQATASSSSSGSNENLFRTNVDGGNFRGAGCQVAGSKPSAISIVHRLSGLATGDRAVKLQWRVTGGTGRIRPETEPDFSHASLLIMEVEP